MGVALDVRHIDVRIAPEHHAAALAALLANEELADDLDAEPATLAEAMEALGWTPEGHGHFASPTAKPEEFPGYMEVPEKFHNTDFALWCALAPYVAEGGSIEAETEGEHWRYRFAGGLMYVDEGAIVFTENPNPVSADTPVSA